MSKRPLNISFYWYINIAKNKNKLYQVRKYIKILFETKFDKYIDWINQNTLVMNQQDFDTQMSRIMTGTEMAISFKTLGIGREEQANFNVIKKKF
jgi:hypothetical protein